MRTRSKLLIAAVAAIALLGTVVSAASARNLENPAFERGFRIVWSELHFEVGGRGWTCPVTLEGRFEARTFAKNNLRNVGRVTEAGVGTCMGSSLTVLTETLPWEMTYQSFAGTLPNITRITLNIIKMSLNWNLEGVACLFTTTTTRPARYIETVSGGTVTSAEAERFAEIETGGGFLCGFAGPGRLAGSTNSITVRGGTEAITIRLI